MDHRLQTTLVMHSLRVDDLHFVDSVASIGQLSIQLTLATISRVQKSAGLFNLTTESVGLTFSNPPAGPELKPIPTPNPIAKQTRAAKRPIRQQHTFFLLQRA